MNIDSNQWHISLHFLPDAEFESGQVEWQNESVKALKIDAGKLQESFPARFDEFIVGINSLSSGYAEGDGSFGVVGPAGAWKICGNIYERDGQIQYAELLGTCPQPSLVDIVNKLNVGPQQCAIQHMQGGFFQSFEQFFGS